MANSQTHAQDTLGLRRRALFLLFLASGFAGLVYEVLWMKELGLLFGNTAQAAATSLAAFFLGLVVGARYWGRRAACLKRPLRGYAALEAGVALSSLLYFLLLAAYRALYAPLFQSFGELPILFLALKFVLAAAALFPPSFFMGGTLPMMSQHLVRRAEQLGGTVSLLYAVNTLGAALGAYAAGFHLPPALGFRQTYLVAIAITCMAAAIAWALGGPSLSRAADRREPKLQSKEGKAAPPLLPLPGIRALAFFSGFATLSLEVLWTRMFAQVLQNSVYTFATILVAFLLALGLGALAANYLIRRAFPPGAVLLAILTGSALLVSASPFGLNWLTGGLDYLSGHIGLSTHGAFWTTFGILLGPALFTGSLFPYVLRLAQPYVESAGRTVGDLTAVNTVGAVSGALAAGFMLLDLLGMWAGIRLVAVGYACAALLIAQRWKPHRRWMRAAPLGVLLLLVSWLDPSRLPSVKVDLGKGESLLQTWESSSAIVSVVQAPNGLSVKMDNSYSLGGTGAALSEARQSHLPLLLHPQPKSVFFLGMGTGITAGAVLAHPVERVVVCELVDDVVKAARVFFHPYTQGLFQDPRVVIVSEDGRNYLSGTGDKYDVIIADLFMPWKAGVGSLYSREHYEAAYSRLRKGGLYAQWLPLFQLSPDEFGVIARTMSEVFPLVTLWRGTILPGWETVMLLGHQDANPLNLEAVNRRLEESQKVAAGEVPLEAPDGSPGPGTSNSRLQGRDFLLRYCGNVTAAGRLFEGYPVNTDDLPVVEYQAPLAHLRGGSDQSPWLIGRALLALLKELLDAVPSEADPYLAKVDHDDMDAVRAGLSLHLSKFLERAGDQQGAWEAMQEFERLYRPGAEAPAGASSELEQTRRELNQLIEKYQQRIRALREHLREAEEAAGAGEATPTQERSKRDQE